MKHVLLSALLLGCGLYWTGCGTTTGENTSSTPARQIYEWRIYTLKPGADAALLDHFFRGQLLPAYNKHGIDVGAFSHYQPYPEAEAGVRVLFFAYPDIESFQRVNRAVREDKAFLESSAGFFAESAPNPVYTNLETYLCEAFDSLPQLRKPGAERELFEFRIYRSPNLEANERKIHMFENGEIGIFDETGINSVCYGRTLAGSRMPSLVYLTWYKDIDTRNEAWRQFQTHPEWARMKALPEYANTATNNTARLLAPMPYSQY